MNRSAKMTVLNRPVNCVTLWLLCFGRHGETSDNRLLWLWTKAAMKLDRGSSTLGITTVRIVRISHCLYGLCVALCWCWECLLTVGGNLLLHIVTPLDVTTVTWCCRQTQDVLHPAEWPPRTLQSSVWQRTASVFTTAYSKGNSFSLCAEDWCLQHYMTLWLDC